MHSGYIGLAVNNKGEERLRYIKYNNKGHRNKIIKGWERYYGQGFEKCFIFIYPNTNDAVHDVSGVNMRFKKENNKYKRASEWGKREIFTIETYNKDGNVVGKFNSCKEASMNLPVSAMSVSISARNNGRLIKGMYSFKYIKKVS
jgi:hypothetical protein